MFVSVLKVKIDISGIKNGISKFIELSVTAKIFPTFIFLLLTFLSMFLKMAHILIHRMRILFFFNSKFTNSENKILPFPVLAWLTG